MSVDVKSKRPLAILKHILLNLKHASLFKCESVILNALLVEMAANLNSFEPCVCVLCTFETARLLNIVPSLSLD